MGYSNNKYIRTTDVSKRIPSNQFIVSVKNKEDPSCTFVEFACLKVQFPKAIGTTEFIVFECANTSKGFEILKEVCEKKQTVEFEIIQSNNCNYSISCRGHFIEYPDIYFNKISSKAISIRFFFNNYNINMRVD